MSCQNVYIGSCDHRRLTVLRFLPARRYASTVLAAGHGLCVNLSVARRYCIETAAGTELLFGTQAFFDLSFIVYLGY